MSMFLLKLGEMRFPLRLGETLLGRSPYCSIVLGDNSVSRQHAAVRLTASELVIEDLGSRNGTKVNGQLINGRRPLHSGDMIEIGKLKLQVEHAPQHEFARRSALAVTGESLTAEVDSPTSPGGGTPSAAPPTTQKSAQRNS